MRLLIGTWNRTFINVRTNKGVRSKGRHLNDLVFRTFKKSELFIMVLREVFTRVNVRVFKHMCMMHGCF